MNVLAGWKTYIGAVVLIAIGGMKIAGIEIAGFEGTDPGTLISSGIMAIFFRKAIAS
jgi:hypothetical protein